MDGPPEPQEQVQPRRTRWKALIALVALLAAGIPAGTWATGEIVQGWMCGDWPLSFNARPDSGRVWVSRGLPVATVDSVTIASATPIAPGVDPDSIELLAVERGAFGPNVLGLDGGSYREEQLERQLGAMYDALVPLDEVVMDPPAEPVGRADRSWVLFVGATTDEGQGTIEGVRVEFTSGLRSQTCEMQIALRLNGRGEQQT